jgi:DNA invertase Pin-like site-specific DNA recombinase
LAHFCPSSSKAKVALRNGSQDYEIFEDENQSGTKKSRPALDDMMKRVRAGECEKVIVYSFSRFARSVTHLLSALQEFENLGVKFLSMSESIDTETPIGRALVTILGSVAQLERDLIAERVKNGLANAKAKGIHIGRHKMRDSDLIRKLLADALMPKLELINDKSFDKLEIERVYQGPVFILNLKI